MTADAENGWDILYQIQEAGLQHWGFTLYRTDYNPDNEERWARLLQQIQQLSFEEIFGKPFGTAMPKKPSPASQIRQELWDAFKTDVRSDEAVYNGMDLDALRAMHKEDIQNEGVLLDEHGEEDRYRLHQFYVFLVADEEVLTKGLDNGWMKAVDARYEAKDFNGNPRMPQFWWGWMKMKIGVSYNLWVGIEVHDEVCDMAPKTTTGVQDEVFDGSDF